MVATGKTVNSLASGARRVSRRLVASYILDWILIAAIAAVGGAFSKIHGAKHAFSLQDPSISYPYHDDTVSIGVVVIVCLVAPGIITAIISLLFIPGPTVHRSTPRSLIWRRKIWEWNTAWMGLALSLASALLITEGLKITAGKPRPMMLAVCDPDTSPQSLARYQVGGLGSSLGSAVPIVVDWHICRNTDASQLRNAFASWPSGHSSFSWAGMLYLSLFLCAKFAIHIPFLPASASSNSRRYISTFDEEGAHDDHDEDEDPSKRLRSASSPPQTPSHPPRNEAAAPPVYLFVIAFVPIGVALFIATSRWFDYKHHGFDIISGSLIGIVTAWVGFRWYHLPIQGGSGWAWGARSRDRAFWLGVGRANYVGEEGWESARIARGGEHRDVEAGGHVVGAGLPDQRESTETGVSGGRS
ncbi:PAP2 superfamily-domain-containing protein [Exophiala viscosa]|uniref:PAP2 superfamily-domain-containing protein n=1 Tax=Exophiala viscosa TaxID=2486360 RepID=A0AAN6E399_9EURO|nr:PAP2 superfamily-domain-containing protein [Exophiala viscosa]